MSSKERNKGIFCPCINLKNKIMKYYKVNQKGKDSHKNVNKSDIYIFNELYTEKELQKITPINSVFVLNCFDVVNISKKSTYFFFGARFSK